MLRTCRWDFFLWDSWLLIISKLIQNANGSSVYKARLKIVPFKKYPPEPLICLKVMYRIKILHEHNILECLPENVCKNRTWLGYTPDHCRSVCCQRPWQEAPPPSLPLPHPHLSSNLPVIVTVPFHCPVSLPRFHSTASPWDILPKPRQRWQLQLLFHPIAQLGEASRVGLELPPWAAPAGDADTTCGHRCYCYC